MGTAPPDVIKTCLPLATFPSCITSASTRVVYISPTKCAVMTAGQGAVAGTVRS